MGREVGLWFDEMTFAIISIVFTFLTILLVTFNVVKSRWYVYLIYFAGLFTAYSTTMLGLSVVGSDISRELLMSNLAIQNGWDLTLYDPSNTSFVVGWLIPQLGAVINGFLILIYAITAFPAYNPPFVPMGLEWIYKVFLPMIFAFTPVILYLIFRKMIGDLKAFYAAMFFIIVPVFALEIAAIGKSMVAETLMALTIWVMFTNWRCKPLVMLGLVLLTLWAHYTVGILLCMYLGGIMIVSFVTKKWWESSINGFYIFTILIIVFIPTMLYYSNVAKGLIWNSATGIFNYNFTQDFTVIRKSVDSSFAATPDINSTVQAYGVVKSALGLDLLRYSWSGIAFRVIQFFTQACLVLGLVWILWKRKLYNFKAEYIAGCVVALGLLGLCVTLPTFASLINATREYHMALFFLAPCFVLAFDGFGNLTRRQKVWYYNDTI
jgi:uncharacterized membrane protein